jgi:predicted membrane-bound dolichyl-phosphate-mannose-protein mannosyltransferase
LNNESIHLEPKPTTGINIGFVTEHCFFVAIAESLEEAIGLAIEQENIRYTKENYDYTKHETVIQYLNKEHPVVMEVGTAFIFDHSNQ